MGFGKRGLTILAVGFLLAATSGSCARQRFCSQCGRGECKNLAFTIRLADGGAVETCCPRCALRYLSSERPVVAGLTVRAFSDAATLDARKAFYVEGSDAHPCSHAEGTPVDERGCCLKAVYDRCEPSLVAFASAQAAESFVRDHGGFVRRFDELKPGRP